MNGTLEEAPLPTRLVRLWYAAFAGIPAWAIHLVTTAALAREACLSPRTTWLMHGITAVCALATVAAIGLSWSLARLDRPERLRFLGRLGLLVGAINLLLILAEGAYVVLVRTCA